MLKRLLLLLCLIVHLLEFALVLLFDLLLNIVPLLLILKTFVWALGNGSSWAGSACLSHWHHASSGAHLKLARLHAWLHLLVTESHGHILKVLLPAHPRGRHPLVVIKIVIKIRIGHLRNSKSKC